MSCNTEEVASLEVINSVKFESLFGAALGPKEFEQALRNVLRNCQDTNKFASADIPMPVRIPDTELAGFSDKSVGTSDKTKEDAQSTPKAKVFAEGRSVTPPPGLRNVTPPPGLENPMKVCSERLASAGASQEAEVMPWHKQAPKHVQIANNLPNNLVAPSSPPSSPTRKARFCTQCGQKVDDKLASARFCTFCGSEHQNMDALYQHAGWDQSMEKQLEEAAMWQNVMGGMPSTMDNDNISPWNYENYYGGSVYRDGAMHQSNYQCYGQPSVWLTPPAR